MIHENKLIKSALQYLPQSMTFYKGQKHTDDGEADEIKPLFRHQAPRRLIIPTPLPLLQNVPVVADNDEGADTGDGDENHGPIHVQHIVNCEWHLFEDL